MPRDVPEPVASKFVVRKLPPELTEDAFKAVLQNVCQDELEWFRYHPGSTGESGITTSTAFIKLRHAELAPILKQLLQNSPFIGDHGVPYHCEMEVAFYQRTPKERAKEDPYVGTYEQDPYYKDFLKEIERQDEAAKKGPTITATTTIAENPADKEPIVTPLMSYVINRYKSGSGRSRNGKGPSGDGREKENRKKLPAIPEKPAAGKSAPPDAPTTGKSAPAKRGRGSKREEKNVKGKAGPSEATNTAQHQDKQQESSQTGKSGRGKGPKGQSRAATNGGSSGGGAAGQPAVPPSTTGAEDSPVVASSADVDAARSAAQAAARVAMQLASDTAGPLSAVGQPEGGAAKNGSAAAPSKAAPKRPRSGRRARGRGGAGGQDAEGAGGDAQGGSQSAAVPAAEQRVTSASERAIAAAAAAASAALQDSAPGERPKPRTRPAFGARGVRDALSRAGIKQPASATTGKQGKQKGGGGGGGAAAGAPAGDGREGSSGP